MIGVYIHIPYCRTLCPYCDFVKERVPGGTPGPFVAALCDEIASFSGPDDVQSVFFGGGTPSLLAPEALERIFAALHDRFRLDGAEVTLEANPDDVREDLAAAWTEIGVNRVSLGVQSFSEAALKYLGRRHDAAQAAGACEIVAGRLANWSMDLIFGAPPVADWGATLKQCVALSPPHVSVYALSYEAGTPFGARAKEAVDEETALGMYQRAAAALEGYEHYEISNFARPGFAARHNLIYWRNGDYAGFGTGAYSYLAGRRERNHAEVAAYIARPGEKAEQFALEAREIRIETLIQHFRLRSGLCKRVYAQRFGTEVEDDFGGQLGALKARGLLVEAAGVIRPTDEGFYLNNEIGLALVD